MAELQIQIGANVSSAVQGLNQVQAELDQTGKSAVAVTNSVGRAASSFSKIPQSAGQANQAITNLNRVVQDAPFGFIGIQNNIGPLVDSFGQLKMSTGSTSGALRALFSSLIGPAGIGLAVAGVTTAITFAIQGFSSWTRGLGAAKDANDELAKSLALDLVNLTTIVGLANNTSASTNDRVNAIKLLNQEYTQYLPNLDKEVITLGNINDKYLEIIDTMLRQAVVKGLQETIAKQVEETAKQIVALEIARERERIGLEKSNNTKFVGLTTDQKLAQIAKEKNQAVSDGIIAYTQQTQAEEAAIGTTNVYKMMIDGLKKQLIDSLAPTLKLASAYDDLNKKLDKGKDVEVKPQKVKLTLPTISTIGGDELEIPPIEQEIVVPVKNVQFDFYDIDKSRKLGQIKAQFEALGLQIPPINLQAIIQNPDILNQLNEQLDAAFQRFNQVSSLVSGTFAPAFDSLFNSIEKGGDAIGGFFDGLAQGIQQLVQALIQTAAIAGLVSLITGTPFSTSFKLLSGITLPGRALGGPVSGGTPYLVGERGPELFMPQVSGSIVPNNSVGSFMSGRMGESGRGTTLRGQDIILAYARTQRSQLRVNG